MSKSMLGLGQIYLAIDQHEIPGPVSREAENKLISAKHLPAAQLKMATKMRRPEFILS